MDYRLDPCIVKRIGGHMIKSLPCIGDLKYLETLRLSFSSEIFTVLQASMCSFHGSHERLFLCLLAPNILFDVDVVSKSQYLIANLCGCEPYSASVYLFLCLAIGLSIAQSCYSRGLSRLCEA